MALAFMATTSCAIMHHAQIGEIDDTGKKGKPFVIKISETGINIDEAASIATAVSGNEESQELADALAMFQMGPTTGNKVFNEKMKSILAIFGSLKAISCKSEINSIIKLLNFNQPIVDHLASLVCFVCFPSGFLTCFFPQTCGGCTSQTRRFEIS